MTQKKKALIHAINFTYKWLPILFGCHCRRDRSFSVRGYRFPICARCTGQLLGAVVCLVTCRVLLPPIYLLCIMALPMVIDGTLQLKTAYESTNVRRFLTGTSFGYACLRLAIWSYASAFRFGTRIGAILFDVS